MAADFLEIQEELLDHIVQMSKYTNQNLSSFPCSLNISCILKWIVDFRGTQDSVFSEKMVL